MTESVPIQLLLDVSLEIKLRENAVMRWAVLNTDPTVEVTELELDARCASQDCRLSPYSLGGPVIGSGKCHVLTQAIRIDHPGRYGIRFYARGAMRGGRRFDLVSDDLVFDVVADGSVRSITIEGGAGGVLVPGNISAETLHIVTDGVVNLRKDVKAKDIVINGAGGVILAGDVDGGQPAINFQPFRLEKAVEIALHHRSMDGLEALDFKRIAADWRGTSNDSVSVSFMDVYGNALTRARRSEHEYRVRVTSRVAGYLYLFACGAEGGYLQLTPYESRSDGRIDVGAPLYFPDDLLPLPLQMQGKPVTCFDFTALGTERILAIVAPTPGVPVPALQLIDDIALIRLLEALSHTRSAAGYAEVAVMS